MTASDVLPWHWLTLHGFFTLLGIGVFLVASHSLRQRRLPTAAMAWVLSLVLMPYLALPLYLLIGARKRTRPLPALRRDSSVPVAQPADRIRILAGTLSLPAPSSCDYFDLHDDGSHALRSLLSVIDSAREQLDVGTFLFGRDALGGELMHHLERAARRGVRVRFMVDGMGRFLGGHPDLGPLRAAGVSVALFAAPFKYPYAGKANLRNHRKLAVADGHRLWTGGRNLAALYFEGDRHAGPGDAPWTDLSFELHGPIAAQAQQLFDRDWVFATQQSAFAIQNHPQPAASDPTSTLQLIPSGPDQSEDTVYTLLVSCCFTARSRILAVSPYFVPDATLQMALALAARRGIGVDLVIPARSNHRMADMARHASLRELTRSGARVWLAPTMIHAKAVVFDGEFAMAGSANLDERSLFLNYELMVGFYRPDHVLRFEQWIERQRQGARPYVARRPGVLRELGEGAIRWLAFQL